MSTLRKLLKYLFSGVVFIILLALSPILVLLYWFARYDGPGVGEADHTLE